MEVTEDIEKDLDDIIVSRGFTVKGIVVDDKGRPVPGARVSLLQALEAEDPMTNLARGNLFTTSDSSGRFAIDGFSITNLTGVKARLSASTMHGAMSLTQHLGNGNHSTTIEVRPTGTVGGVVHLGNSDVMLIVTPVSNVKHRTYTKISNASYQVVLPEGVYDLRVLAMTGSVPPVQRRITVVAGSNIVVDFP